MRGSSPPGGSWRPGTPIPPFSTALPGAWSRRSANSIGITLTERAFSVDEAKTAREAFLTSTTALVKPVTRIDGTGIGDGEIGPVTEKLLEFYLDHMLNPEGGRP